MIKYFLKLFILDGNSSRLDVSNFRVLHGQSKVQEEDDAGCDTHNSDDQSHRVSVSYRVSVVLIVRQTDNTDGDVESRTHQIDEQFLKFLKFWKHSSYVLWSIYQNCQVRSQEISYKDRRDDDCETDESSDSQEMIAFLGDLEDVTVIAKAAEKKTNENQDLKF